MLITPSAVLLSAATLFELALAGPKRSRTTNSTDTLVSYSNSSAVSINIRTKTGHRNATAPLLYGWMFEDINHSGDGGLYGELLRNRAFEGSDVRWGAIDGYTYNSMVWQENECQAMGPVLTGYSTVGGTTIRLDSYHPLSQAHQVVLALDIPTTVKTSTTPVGFANSGWWGIGVTPQKYKVSFYIYPSQVRNQDNLKTSLTVSLTSNANGKVWASTIIPAQSWNVVNYTLVEAQLITTEYAPDANNSLVITFDPVATAGQTYYFDQISLFGETFKGYKNGLRKDLAQHIYDLGPKMMRWPGGNNIEGYSFQRRWKWWETIGPLKDRVPRPGNWLYPNTNGLGLMEFLEWTEAMKMENVLAIYSGYSLGDAVQWFADEYPATPEAMYPLLKEALDQLEFCTGSVHTYWGAKRAEYGHPEPFVIKYVEIGNEDWFSKNYPFRFKYLYDGLKAAYPHITYISSAYDENGAYTIDLPAGSMWDTHHYEPPRFFISRFDFFDNWQQRTNNPNVTIMIGEYSVLQVDTPSGIDDWSFPPDIHIFYPRLVSAIAEGVYLLGAERNPNVVKMSSYAPSLQNWNWFNWTPNLIAFDADPRNTVLSVSYYLQKLFNQYRGTESVQVTNSKGDFGPLFWGATVEGRSKVFLKVINVNATAVPLTVEMESQWRTVNGTIITHPDLNAFNFKNNATGIIPLPVNLTSTKPSAKGIWEWNVPPYSITVLQFNV